MYFSLLVKATLIRVRAIFNKRLVTKIGQRSSETLFEETLTL